MGVGVGVTVDRGESQGIMLCSGVCGASGQGRVTRCHAAFRRMSQGVILCSGGRGDSGQGRVARCHTVFRRA